MNPELSIVMPLRDGEATIAEAVESCLRQSFSRFELIVVINGCTDGSEEIVQGLAGRDRRIRVVRSPVERGVTGAMGGGDGYDVYGVGRSHGCR